MELERRIEYCIRLLFMCFSGKISKVNTRFERSR